MLADELADGPAVGLPSFFSFALVMLEEVLVGSEDWKLNYGNNGGRRTRSDEVVRETLEDSGGW